MRYALACAVCLLLLPRAVAADDDIHLVKLTITPAARPVPVMKYRLTPVKRDLKAGNAAALYYRAIVELRESYRQIDPRLKEEWNNEERFEAARHALDGDWIETPRSEFPMAEAKLGLEYWNTPLNEIELGVTREQAIWDLPLREEGVATRLPEIQDMRNFARLLSLRARIEIIEGRFQDAAATLRTLIRIGEHTSESGTLVSSLVGIAATAIAFGQVEQWIDAPDSPNLYWALTALPNPPIYISVGLESEHLWIESGIPYLDLIETSILSEEQGQQLYKSFSRFLTQATESNSLVLPGGLKVPHSSELSQLLPMLATYPSAKRELIERGRKPEEVERMPVAQVVVMRSVQEYRHMLDEMLSWTSQPYAESMPALDELDDRIMQAGSHPSGSLAALLLPAVGAARRAEVRLQQRVAFLRVIEALRLYAASHGGGLPARLSEITEVPIPLDPSSNQPFVYELKGATATLRSKTPEVTLYDQRYEITVRK